MAQVLHVRGRLFRASLLIAIFLLFILGFSACGGGSISPTPDIAATVESAISKALPTPTATSGPDFEATVVARVEATTESSTAPTFVARTPIPTATPTKIPVAASTAAPIPTATPIPTEIPTFTSIPSPQSTTEIVQQARSSVVRVDTDIGMGSGFIFEVSASTNTALILTNYHVIDDAYEIWVTVNDNLTYQGEVTGVDVVRDLAVLKICCGQFKALSLGGAADLLSGMPVITIGYPLGLEGEASVTTGIVSARRYDDDHNAWTIQTDAPINPGNSGGPLLSADGYVLGVNTYIRRTSTAGIVVEGMGFAISEQTITPLLPSLKAQALVVVPTPAPQPSVTSDVYNSQKYWYSIAIPRGWELYVESDESVAVWDKWQTGTTLWISIEEIDESLYPTIKHFTDIFQPKPPENALNYSLDSGGSIRTDRPNEAYEFHDSYIVDNEKKKTTSHWYLLGNRLIRLDAIADEDIWTLDYYSNTRQALLSTLESFEPATYHDAESGYSVAHPTDWELLEIDTSDYYAYDPYTSAAIYIKVHSKAGYTSIGAYGADSGPREDGIELSRGLVFENRPNPGYRFDFTYVYEGSDVRGAAVITLSETNAVWVFVDAYEEDWSEAKDVFDEILSRIAVQDGQ